MKEKESSFIEPENNQQEKEKQKQEFCQFLAEQSSLPPEKWSEEFKRYIDKKYEESQPRDETEPTPEEKRELTFQRYLKGLELRAEDLNDKRFLDLGCGDGEFVRECLDRDITQQAYGLDVQISPNQFEEKYQSHFAKVNFEEAMPFDNIDYVISIGAVEASFSEEVVADPEKTIRLAFAKLKEDGEIRIYPIRKMLEEKDRVLILCEKNGLKF